MKVRAKIQKEIAARQIAIGKAPREERRVQITRANMRTRVPNVKNIRE